MSAQKASIPITVRGRYLWRGDGRFIVRGVAYQAYSAQDPISDDRLPQLEHDILLFRELGLNTLYVFGIDNTKEHAKAMKLLEDAGLYVVTSVSTASCAINRMDPQSSYNSTTLFGFFRAVDAMAHFPNTLGILAASLVVNDAASLPATPVIRAVVRDLKKYMKLQHGNSQQRVIPIGYESANTPWDTSILEYFCSSDTSSSIDFWMISDFSPAPNPSTAQSNFNDLINRFGHVEIPIFLSQYGSSAHQPRQFHETTALYSQDTTPIISGGCVYEFCEASNGYGLVDLRKSNGETQNTANRMLIDMLTRHGDTQAVADLIEKTRKYDSTTVAEERKIEGGLVLVFHDFFNYRSKLSAVRSLRAEVEQDQLAGEEQGELSSTHFVGSHSDWPRELVFCEPDTCVDWENLDFR